MNGREYSKIHEIRKYFWPTPPQPRVLFERPDISYDNPRRDFGDFYCVICDAQMDTEMMWKNHITGNRHYWNSLEYASSDEEPFIQREMDRISSPIAGLDYLCEIICTDQPIVYQCMLCPSGLTTPQMLIMHILGLKHQMAFLKEHAKDNYSLINSLSLMDLDLEPVVQNIISKYELDHGRGNICVKRLKIRPGYRYSTKYFLDDASEKCPPKSFKSPSKSYRMNEQLSEWNGLPFRERSKHRRYVDKPYSYSEMHCNPESPIFRKDTMSLDIQDSRAKRDIFYFPDSPPHNEQDNHRDYRVALDKKNHGKISRVSMDASVTYPSEISEYSDTLLRLVNNATAEAFLKLALFKLDKIDVKEGLELSLLDRLANKATIKVQNSKKSLQSKDTFVPNNLLPELNNVRDAPPLVMHQKTPKTTLYEDVSSKKSDESLSKASEKSISNKSVPNQQLHNSNIDQNTSEISIIYDSGCGNRQSNSVPNHSSSSKTISIPGLTLIEEFSV